MSVSTDVPKIDLMETLKTWQVLAKTMVIMSAAIVMQRAEAIHNHSVASNVLALSDIDFMGQWYLDVTENAAVHRTYNGRVTQGDNDESIR